MSRIFVIAPLLLVFLMGSCVNLRHVGKFSETSLEGVEQYEAIVPRFSKICSEDCQHEYIRKFEIHRTDCDCDQDRKADSITGVIHDAAMAYFQGLSNLAQNELTAYSTDGLTQALSAGNFGPVKLNETDVKAYSKISTLLLRAFTDGFRRQKVKEYVAEAHGPLLKLINFLELNLSGNLMGKLEVQKSGLKNFYFDFIRDENLSDYERTKFAEDYFQRIADIQAQQDELQNYSEVLREISEGHTTLYNNVGNMTDDEVQKDLAGHSWRLKNTISLSRHR